MLAFGAWCIRDYGFEYKKVRAHQGLSFYPLLVNERIVWQRNLHYKKTQLIEKKPRQYKDLGIIENKPIYTQYADKHDAFDFVTEPKKYLEIWNNFVP